MKREIGSEFSTADPDNSQGLIYPLLGSLVFSGRTAIETVLMELPEAQKALLPSYCCESMIQPFREAGIEVGFYSVNYDNELKIEVKLEKDVDIFFWCNYFGFNVPLPELGDFSGVIIEDITHSLFSDYPYHQQSDYLVASLRKWEPVICGGYCAAKNGNLHYAPALTPPQKFIETKKNAMSLKAEYLSELDENKKPKFLAMFNESNHWLADNYSGLAIDRWSRDFLGLVDMDGQRQIRRNNAMVLYRGLKNAQFLFAEEAMDCPLFVPIILENRDSIRRALTESQIYCPIHWPKPGGAESNLYATELSLICDQRYNEDDMERIVSVLGSLL